MRVFLSQAACCCFTDLLSAPLPTCSFLLLLLTCPANAQHLLLMLLLLSPVAACPQLILNPSAAATAAAACWCFSPACAHICCCCRCPLLLLLPQALAPRAGAEGADRLLPRATGRVPDAQALALCAAAATQRHGQTEQEGDDQGAAGVNSAGWFSRGSCVAAALYMLC